MTTPAVDVDDDGLVYPNGVDIRTGQSHRPIPAEHLARMAAGEPLSAAQKKLIDSRKSDDEEAYGVSFGVNPYEVSSAGWCVVFAQGADPRIREALQPLLDLRRSQAGQHYRECIDTSRDEQFRGFNPAEDLGAFLLRFGVAPGEPANPKRLPYYVLLVGGPAAIPFEFQSQLDVTYAVGRLSFESLDDYHTYAAQVVRSERAETVAPKRALFLGTRNPGDRPTRRSSELLVKPLADMFEEDFTGSGWSIDRLLGEDAKKARLAPFMGGTATPGLIFTATHGAKVPFDTDSEQQRRDQGALVCQEWGGPLSQGPVPPEHYFSAADIPANASFPGTVAFLFACYGAGTPLFDDFAPEDATARTQIAPQPFMARLPQAMLTRGALAVVGHIDRAWGYSFNWPRVGSQCDTFRGSISGIAAGQPVGAALDGFNVRYATLSAVLLDELRQRRLPYPKQNDAEVAGLWTATTDARNYVLLGDPAARLRV